MDSSNILEFTKKPIKPLLMKRVYATTIDLLFISLLSRGIFHTYLNFLKTIFHHLTYASQKYSSDLFVLFFTIFGATFFGYFVLSLYLGGGQTPGKMIFNLKIVSLNETSEITLLDGIKRTIGYFLCYNLGFILFGIPFFRKDHRGLPDFLSKTFVTTTEQVAVPSIEVNEIDKAA